MVADHVKERREFVAAFEPVEEGLALFRGEVEEALTGFRTARGLERGQALMIGGAETREGSIELVVNVVDGAGLGGAWLLVKRDHLLGDSADKRSFLSVQKVCGEGATSRGEAAPSGDPKQRHLEYDTAFFAGVGRCFLVSMYLRFFERRD